MKYLWFWVLFGWNAFMIMSGYGVFMHPFDASGAFGPLLIITIMINGYYLWVFWAELKNKYVINKITIIKILNFVGYRLANLSSYFIEKAVCMQNIIAFDPVVEDRYKREDPNNMLIVTYPLDPNSLVIDVGGYTGDWATRIYCLYSCYIDVYEPHPIFSTMTKNVFVYNNKVAVYDFGLSDHNDTTILYGCHKNASLYQNNEGVENSISIRKTSEVFNEKYGSRVIDLLKINVEGSEYTILPDLINNFDMTKIKNILIEYHKNVDDYSDKRKSIQEKLSTTHELVWNYDYIFESWRLKVI